MTDQYLTVRFETDAPPAIVYAAINNVEGWWSPEFEGASAKVGDEFTYSSGDIHKSTQRVTEQVPDLRVVWRVTEGYLNFTKDPAEWTGTDIVFDITPVGDTTRVTFTHVGLSPDIECFDSCTQGWEYYAGQRLPQLIASVVNA
jgi:Activator of Hsp90 ATPase homolog 1-like protein